MNLNYHHLRLFRAVALEGNLTRASHSLCLTPQTVSAQVRTLEANLDVMLFSRVGRGMELTEAGRLVLGFANDIFSLGQELRETLRGQPSERAFRLVVGVVSTLPKLIVHRLIKPTLHLDHSVRVLCKEGTSENMVAELAVHHVDVVLSDAPLPSRSGVRAFNHHLGRCGVTFMASPTLAQSLRDGFPASLDLAPVLLPTSHAILRSKLDRWFHAHGLRPVIAAEFEDSGLLKAFGQGGVGFFVVPSVIEEEVAAQYVVESIGRTDELVENFYAISMERRVRHVGVAAICDSARSELFSWETGRS